MHNMRGLNMQIQGSIGTYASGLEGGRRRAGERLCAMLLAVVALITVLGR
jgi:hypothetical protein